MAKTGRVLKKSRCGQRETVDHPNGRRKERQREKERFGEAVDACQVVREA
jgi:hypothetical protein